MTDSNTLAAKAWEDAFNAAMGDVVAGFSDERATAAIAAVYAPRIAELEAEVVRLREALVATEGAIAEYYRYWTGGEMRGSYDGKPERASLWKSRQTARTALGASHD